MNENLFELRKRYIEYHMKNENEITPNFNKVQSNMYVDAHPKEVEYILNKWAGTHPTYTLATDFYKKYLIYPDSVCPNAVVVDFDCPYGESRTKEICDICIAEYWSTPTKEVN